jgi:hypothetical protein
MFVTSMVRPPLVSRQMYPDVNRVSAVTWGQNALLHMYLTHCHTGPLTKYWTILQNYIAALIYKRIHVVRERQLFYWRVWQYFEAAEHSQKSLYLKAAKQLAYQSFTRRYTLSMQKHVRSSCSSRYGMSEEHLTGPSVLLSVRPSVYVASSLGTRQPARSRVTVETRSSNTDNRGHCWDKLMQ